MTSTSKPGHLQTFMSSADSFVEQLCQIGISALCNGSELQKILFQITVFPPSQLGCIVELTLSTNYTILCTAIRARQNLSTNVHCAGISLKLPNVVFSALSRVLQLCKISSSVPVENLSPSDVDSQIEVIVTLCSDPLVHFELLPLLRHLSFLISAWCLYRQSEYKIRSASQKGHQHSIHTVFLSLHKLFKLLDQETLEGRVILRGGLMLCCDQSDKEGLLQPSASDAVNLVLLACSPDLASDIQLSEWRWLSCFIKCKQLCNAKDSESALGMLQNILAQPLDLEKKSQLLCLLASIYKSMSCDHLSRQAYRAALEANPDNFLVFLQFAEIYNDAGDYDVELECLSIFAQKVAESDLHTDDFVMDWDSLVSSVCGLFPKKTYLSAVRQYAKCCFELHRFKEAAEQYMKILNYLQNSEKIKNTLTSDDYENVPEFVVEGAESLVMASRYEECLVLCQDFLPYLLSADSQDSKHPYEINVHFGSKSSQNTTNSPDILFSSPDFKNNQTIDNEGSYVSQEKDNLHQKVMCPEKGELISKTNRSLNPVLTPGALRNLCNSRKRKRPVSCGDDLSKELEKSSNSQVFLAARILMCQTDCLVSSTGYTEEAMMTVKRAYVLLLDSKPIYTASPNIDQPSSKRQKTGSSSEESSKQKPLCFYKSISTLTKIWSRLLIETALRMGQISLKKKAFSSAFNACHLVMQLEDDSTRANFLRAKVAMERGVQSEAAAREWLEFRRLDCTTGETMKSLQRKLCKSPENDSEIWWNPSDNEFLSFDMMCLKLLIPS